MKILKCFANRKLLGSLATRHYLKLDSLKRQYCLNEDQKTTVDVLNQPGRGPLMLNSYSTHGFRLNSGLFVVGPVILFSSTIISWNVENDADIGEEALSIFSKIEPKLDIVLIGLAGKISESAKHMNRIHQEFKKFNINCEVMATERACPTFNYLNVEGRHMAAALIPPLNVVMNEDDLKDEFNRIKEHMQDDYLIYTDLFAGKTPKDPKIFTEQPKSISDSTKNDK